MGKVTDANTGKSEEVAKGAAIKGACEKLGVPFSCSEGICGTCRIEVSEGQDNLSPINEKETDLGADKSHRFACQCKLKQGDVKVSF